MLMPGTSGENMFDEFFRDPFLDSKDMKELEEKLYGCRGRNLMKTDIREIDTRYELEMGPPGFRRDEIKVFLRDGYLTISTAKGLDKDEQKKAGSRYIRQKRYAGTYEGSLHMGKGTMEDDIRGEFKRGILRLFTPKKEAKPLAEEKKYISIEG